MTLVGTAPDEECIHGFVDGKVCICTTPSIPTESV